MSRLAKLCAALIVAAGLPLAAQTGAISWQAIDQYGQPLPHAQVRVCSATSTGVPCNPTVPIYLDYNLITPVSNPYTADQYGNFSFYVPALPFPNVYVVQLSPASGITWSYLFDGPGGPGGSGCTTVGPAGTLQASNGAGGCESAFVQVNGSNLATATAPNLVNSATVTVNNPGTNQVSFTAIPGSTLAISTNSTPNTSQAILNFTDTSSIHFTNPSGGVESATCTTATSSVIGCSRPDNSTITVTSGVLTAVPSLIIQAEDITLGGKFAAAAGQTLDFSSSLPAAPTGFQNCKWQTDTATGRVSCYTPSTATPSLDMVVTPPIAGQFAIVYPTGGVITADPVGVSNIFGGAAAAGGHFQWQCTGLLCSIAGNIQAHWTGFSLPSYINPANVTAIYADAITTSGPVRPDWNMSDSFSGTNLTCFNTNLLMVSDSAYPYNGTEVTILTSMTGANFNANAACSIQVGGSGPGAHGQFVDVATVRYLVYYTGTPPPPVDTAIHLQPPLNLNVATNTLFIDQSNSPAAFWVSRNATFLPPVAGAIGSAFLINNGVSPTDCSAGGGTFKNACYSDGASYTAIFSSGNGSGDTITSPGSTLTVGGTSTATTLDLNLAHANTWTGQQTQPAPIFSNILGTTQCLHVNTAGQVSGTGSDCGSGGGASYVNVVASSSGDTTVSAINAKCSGGQTYWASIPLSIATGGTIASGCNVMFVKGGLWTIASGQTVTFANPIKENDGPSQHIAGTGTVVLAAQNALFSWWGAVGDGTTDDHIAIQNCLAAVTNGECIGNAGTSYAVGTSTLTITKSNIGIGGASINPSFTFANTSGASPTIITSSSATASILYMHGTGNSPGEIVGNTIHDLSFRRSTTPSSTAKNLDIEYTLSLNMQRVWSDDGIYDFYFIDPRNAHINDNLAQFGYHSVNETSGSVYGFYFFSPSSPSVGFYSPVLNSNLVQANNLVTATSYGYVLTGALLSDFNAVSPLTFQMSYGAYVDGTSLAGGGFHAGDIHFTNVVFDTCGIACIYVTGITAAGTGEVEFNEGWISASGGLYGVDIESSSGVFVSGLQIAPNTGMTTAMIYLHNTQESTVTGNHTFGGAGVTYINTSASLILDGSTLNSISGNSFIINPGGTTITNVQLKNTSTYNAISGNQICGGNNSNTGISADATSSNNSYLNFNSICAYTTPISDAGSNNQLATATQWSAITNPTGNLALTMGSDTTTFTFNATTGSSDLFKWTDTASNTGTGILGHFTTASSSTEIPWQADANGVGWRVDTAGLLVGVSSKGIKLPEGTAATGVASYDLLTADSTTHRLLENANNAGAIILSGTAAARTSGDCVAWASNGIDLIDAGGACGISGGGAAFSAITTSTNTTATMTVGSGASILTSGTGINSANQLNAVPFCSGFTPTNGQALEYTTGGSPNPCYTAATVGGLPTSESHTASNSASLAFTTCISASYKHYAIAVYDIVPATNSVAIYMQASADGGSTYDTSSSNYIYGRVYSKQGSSTQSGDGGTSTGFVFWTPDLVNTSTTPLDGSFELFNPLNTSAVRRLHGSIGATGSGPTTYGMTWYETYTASSTQINAFRIIASTGNITSGTVVCQPLPY